MAHDLHLLIRATYHETLLRELHRATAFDRAVEVFTQHRPGVNEETARQHVEWMLDHDPGEVRYQAEGDWFHLIR